MSNVGGGGGEGQPPPPPPPAPTPLTWRGGLSLHGFESSLPPCKHNQSGLRSGSESPCKRGFGVYLRSPCYMPLYQVVQNPSPPPRRNETGLALLLYHVLSKT